MGYVTEKCPKCGAEFNEKCNAWVYGSPIRKCRKCGEEFFDDRWRELAIDGADPRSTDPKFYLKGTIGLLLFSIICGAAIFYMMSTRGHCSIKLIGCFVLGVIGTIGCFVCLIRNLSGYEERQYEKYLEESRERLRDKDYVEKLIEFGCNVPEEYRKTPN